MDNNTEKKRLNDITNSNLHKQQVGLLANAIFFLDYSLLHFSDIIKTYRRCFTKKVTEECLI